MEILASLLSRKRPVTPGARVRLLKSASPPQLRARKLVPDVTLVHPCPLRQSS